MAGAMNKKAAKLIDVAQRANVSRATAARALGGYGLVTDATRDKVLAAANELNYRVNELARSMRSGRTLTIGVVVADIANSFFNSVIRSIIETASKAGYQILVLNTDDDIERERKAVRVLIEKRVDGLIVVPSSQDEIDHLITSGEPDVPIVLLDRTVNSEAIDFVVTDDFEASRSAICYLASVGHIDVGLLVSVATASGHTDVMPKHVVWTVRERVSGAMAAFSELGLKARKRWTRYSQCNVEIARNAAIKILSAKPRPTAILATNEEMALGTLSAAGKLGLVIGEDLSIIGFDDAPWASVFNPPLSVIRRPVAEFGGAAVELLLEKIADSGLRRSRKFTAELVVRASVGAPRA
jgi:LacI family transcriptional regulator